MGEKPRRLWMRRKAIISFAAAALAVAATLGQASAGSQTTAGEDSTYLDTAAQWFFGQREAPNTYVNPAAYAALAREAASLPTVTTGSWTERTPNNYFTDSPTYAPIGASCGANCLQNSGSGERYVTGRMTAVTVAKNGDIFAGAADGGIWKSSYPDRGQHWTPVGDFLGTMSIGALLIDNDTSNQRHGSYTVYAGTGEANTSSDSYAGIGVLKSTNGGATWTSLPTSAVYPSGKASDSDLLGALTFRLLRNGNYLYAATSHGLFRINPAADSAWTRVLSFDNGATNPVNLRFQDMITDVIALPGAGHLLAVAGWRVGSPTNGLYESFDGGNSFTFIANPNGWVPASQQGRVTLAASADGGTIVAAIQNTSTFVKPNASGTILAGVYESTTGAQGPWNQIASSGKLSSSGSAEATSAMRGYKPGVQAWYNQFLAIDPSDSSHIYLGLEEVYETTNGGTSWNTLGPYWNLTLKCFSYTPFEGSCNHQETHPDQHAVFLDTFNNRNTLFVGNDGGVWSKSMSDHSQGNWTDLNNNIDTLQYYSAVGANDGSLYGGMQDNGSNLVLPRPGTVAGDEPNSSVPATSVQVFGGDGGYTVVDPTNPQNVITEYTGLSSALSNDGGRTWTYNNPADPDPRFISPIIRDYTVPVVNGNAHILAGGAYVWDSTKGFHTTTSDWNKIFDLTTIGGPLAQTTAIGTATVNGVTTTWVGWCGPCNPGSSGNGFHSGVVELSNAGGSYHLVASYTPTAANKLPNRYITGVFVNRSNPDDAYLSFSGYSRNWYVGGNDPGVGHVWEITGGAAYDRSGIPSAGGLIDAPTADILVYNGELIAGTDFGVYVSKDNGTNWSRLGANLPNVVVDQLTVADNGTTILAATHGRGLWTYPVNALP
jgi:hypothetical protein